jgi:hypothetical protein
MAAVVHTKLQVQTTLMLVELMENMSDVMIECSANYPTTNMCAEDGRNF